MAFRTWIFLILAALTANSQIFGVATPAATYYVDSINGSDSNNGTSAATPFLTITHVMSLPPATGAVIALGTSTPGIGASWKGQTINTSISGLSFVGYGALQPMVDCSAPISAGAWTKTAGLTNVYQATVAVENVLGWIRLWENNVGFIRPFPDTQAQLDATASAYRVSGDPNGGGTVSFTLYVHTSDGSNPAVNGKSYDYNEFGCITLLGNNSTLINLHTQRNLGNNGSIDCHGSFCKLTDTLSEDGTKHNVYVGTGSYVWRSVAHNGYYGGIGSTLFVFNGNTPNYEGITFSGTNAYMDSPSSGPGGFEAYDGHVNLGGSFGQENYLNVSATNTASFISSGNYTFEYILNPSATNVAGGSEIGGPTLISGGTQTCSSVCVQMVGAGPLTISNASMTSQSQVVQMGADNATLTITGSTLTGPSFAGYIVNGNGANGTVLNVHLTNINGASALTYWFASGSPTLSSDNNAFQTNSFNFNIGGTSYSTVSAYQAGTGQDAHSTHP